MNRLEIAVLLLTHRNASDCKRAFAQADEIIAYNLENPPATKTKEPSPRMSYDLEALPMLSDLGVLAGVFSYIEHGGPLTTWEQVKDMLNALMNRAENLEITKAAAREMLPYMVDLIQEEIPPYITEHLERAEERLREIYPRMREV